MSGQTADPAKQLLDETREEVTRADAKATTLLSVNGILIAALLAAAIGGHFDPRSLWNDVEWLFWSGMTAILASEVLFCAAVFPRVWHPPSRGRPRYFGHVVEFASADALRREFERSEDPAERTVDELIVLSRIVVRKYRFVAVAQVLTAVGVVANSVAVLVGAS